jgi:RNA polymerase sigma factor (sigma-70 family)
MNPPSDDLDRLPRDYADFYRATSARTFTAARSMAGGDEHVAHDATQEAYVSMWRCWARWTDRSIRDAGSYVVGIALHKVADAFRRKPDLPLPEDFEPTNHEPGYDEILARSLRRSLADLIDRQPPRRRAVAILYFIEGRAYPEIASTLQITESTVRTHVERMRVLMKPLVAFDENTRGGERP